eukprot:3075433-Prymnesium_polylepis.3
MGCQNVFPGSSLEFPPRYPEQKPPRIASSRNQSNQYSFGAALRKRHVKKIRLPNERKRPAALRKNPGCLLDVLLAEPMLRHVLTEIRRPPDDASHSQAPQRCPFGGESLGAARPKAIRRAAAGRSPDHEHADGYLRRRRASSERSRWTGRAD